MRDILPILIKTYSKRELADMYGISTKTFRRWCIGSGIYFGREKLLCPGKVRLIFEELGPPSDHL